MEKKQNGDVQKGIRSRSEKAKQQKHPNCKKAKPVRTSSQKDLGRHQAAQSCAKAKMRTTSQQKSIRKEISKGKQDR